MKYKIIFAILLIITFVSKAEIPNVQTCGKSMSIALIDIAYPHKTPPELLIIGFPDTSSVEIDSLNSVESFIKALCRQGIYISPSCITFGGSMYMKYWTQSENLYEAGEKFCYSFSEKEAEFGESIHFTLIDDTEIKITYFDISGFFIYGEKKKIYPLGEISLGIDYMENQNINDVWFIMDVVSYRKTRKMPFLFISD